MIMGCNMDCSEMGIEQLENELDNFDYIIRKNALLELVSRVEDGSIDLKPISDETNMHYHTFFSYNCCGWSPMKIAWLAKKEGLEIVGSVDFDVLDGLDEFYEAAAMLDLKAEVGIETRTFLSEFSTKVINSPGEPGVCYHMGTGMPNMEVPKEWEAFKKGLKETSAQRNKKLIEKINEFLSPVKIDYERDLLPLTPAGNATERHICSAYAKKAIQFFGEGEELGIFWSSKLRIDADKLDLPDSGKLHNTLRAKTMKQGGVGYVQPGPNSFPEMKKMNGFVLASGGIPTLAWLDGTSEGEAEIEELLKIEMASGVAAVNIIPDRNFTPGCGEDDMKCKNLYHFVEIAKGLGLPIIAGTEMNSPGQKFVDLYSSKELSPLKETFLEGANIIYGHSVLQRIAGMGYMSEWSDRNFKNVSDKNIFFKSVGENMKPSFEVKLCGITQDDLPEDILNRM